MAHIGKAFENACILNGVGVVAIIANSMAITKVGRRRVFLIVGLLICGLAQLLTAVIYNVHPGTVETGKGIVGLSVVYIVAYNVWALLSFPSAGSSVTNWENRVWSLLMPGYLAVSSRRSA